MSAENKSEILANIAKLERRLDQRQQEFKDMERRLGLLEIASKELTQSMVERMEQIKELEKSAEDIGGRMAEMTESLKNMLKQQPKGDEYVSDADLDDVAVELENDESEKPQPDDVYQ